MVPQATTSYNASCDCMLTGDRIRHVLLQIPPGDFLLTSQLVHEQWGAVRTFEVLHDPCRVALQDSIAATGCGDDKACKEYNDVIQEAMTIVWPRQPGEDLLLVLIPGCRRMPVFRAPAHTSVHATGHHVLSAIHIEYLFLQ